MSLQDSINSTLKALAVLIQANKFQILEANSQDLLLNPSISDSLLERLKLNDAKLDSLISAINTVQNLESPVGKLIYEHNHANGLKIQNRTVPFGKLLIIYESRPDVTIEASITAFKAGNKVYLKGGKESLNTNLKLVELWHTALAQNNLPEDFITYLNYNREQTQDLIKNNPLKLDLLVPRGGESLINYVQQNSIVPLLISGRGNNFMYIDSECDFEMACSVALNGKSRLSVCNALDKILIHKDLNSKIPELIKLFETNNIQVITSEFNAELLSEEFLSAKIYIQTVDSFNEAVTLINNYSGGHSASIITNNTNLASDFQEQVDCAAVYHNASVRFTDGFEFGYGAEMAVGTRKLHARGPIGVNQLVTNKWYIYGNGQIR